MDDSPSRILVAEDEDSLREMLVIVFEDEGYHVDAAANGKDAWDLMIANNYDLLATDLYMPQMNGVDLILKCQGFFPKTKTILTSGGGKEIEAKHGEGLVKFLEQEIKVDMFLKKPWNLSEMLSFVDTLLQK